MKKTISIILILLFFLCSSTGAQQFGLSIYVGPGFSKFAGPGAASTSMYHLSDVASIPSGPINPYGGQFYTGWQAGLQGAFRLDNRWHFLIHAQYERTGGSMNIDTMVSIGGFQRIRGNYSLFHDFISVNPQLAGVVLNKGLKLNLSLGIDYAFRVERGDEFEYEHPNGEFYAWGSSGGVPESNEFRLTGGLQLSYKRVGIGAIYKHGLTDARENSDVGKEVFSRIWQVNFLYHLLRVAKK